jgi:hypothetical protein
VTDLVEFIRQRLDEDEAAARAASAGGRWRYEGGESIGAWTLYDEHWRIASLTTYRYDEYDYAERMPSARHPNYVDADANGEHIARHDPARVLREVEAKRAMLGMCVVLLNPPPLLSGTSSTASRLEGIARDADRRQATLFLHALALPYADHPDYREEWRP